MTTKEKCLHNILSFGSGGYLVICNECQFTWHPVDHTKSTYEGSISGTRVNLEKLQKEKANRIRKKIDEIKGTPKRIGPNIVNPTLGPKPSTGSSITYFEQAKERSLDRQGDTLLNLGVPNKDAVTEFHWTAGEGLILTDEQKSRTAKRFGGAISHQGTHFETGCPGCEAMEKVVESD